jgi:hypothetical protein
MNDVERGQDTCPDCRPDPEQRPASEVSAACGQSDPSTTGRDAHSC